MSATGHCYRMNRSCQYQYYLNRSHQYQHLSQHRYQFRLHLSVLQPQCRQYCPCLLYTSIELNKILAGLANRENDNELIYSFKTSEMHVESEEEVPWTLDGEFGGSHTDLTLSLIHI